MAMNKEQAGEIIEAMKAMSYEHGDVAFMIAVKDEDDYWRYSMNINVCDSLTLIRTISNESIGSIEDEQSE